MVKLNFLEERAVNVKLLLRLRKALKDVFSSGEVAALYDIAKHNRGAFSSPVNSHKISIAKETLYSAWLFAETIEADHNILLALLLHPYVVAGAVTVDKEFEKTWGKDVAHLCQGLMAVDEFSTNNSVADQDNYRGLLLSLAKDIRVVIMMIVRNLALMRMINRHPDEAWVRNVAFEANCLYAQLAHRLGLYKIKGELEDLSLKYSNREVFTNIAHKLNETKRERDEYIASFIAPVRQRLQEAGLTFEIKGRTKSISSIWAKIQKQKVDLNGIYDLFAIRVIIDTPREKEKQDCWLAYSILADMYTANPARMKDWITMPKSNGYESLHATVRGPQGKWVEVQFRTVRMDLVAEKGLAAHWRYKGGHSDSTDLWMNNIRDILETADAGPMELMKSIRMNPSGNEVFAFTPKGDLFRLPLGASVLDFAFLIHTKVGSKCTGAVVNGRLEKINYKVKSGDTIEILTSSNQKAKQDWLNYVVTSKARNKIRQSLNEEKLQLAAAGKEMLERRTKNRKLEIDEALMMRLLKKQGYTHANDFFADLAAEKYDLNRFLTEYVNFTEAEAPAEEKISAGEFRLVTDPEEKEGGDEAAQDVLIIGGESSIKGMPYKFAKCCSPIQGDEVFGFVASDHTIKVHKVNCPNAKNIRRNYPYRLIPVKWSGKASGLFVATLRVVGTDDIGIVTNITSIIGKETGCTLRAISIDSHDGLFQGYLQVGVADTTRLNQLIKKIKGVKGVKDATRTL